MAATTTITVNAFRAASVQRWTSLSSSSSTRQQTKPMVVLPSTKTNLVLFSSVGDGNDGGGGNGDDKDGNGLGDFLDPMKKPDSEDMKRAREYMSETSLPISFDSVGGIADQGADNNDEGDAETKDADLMPDEAQAEESSSLVSSASSRGNATSSALFGGAGKGENAGPSPSLLAKNPYMQVVSKISPSDLIAKFTAESDPRVQEAVRTTILGLIGSLPKLAFETTSITTGQRLASLMFQLQMTG